MNSKSLNNKGFSLVEILVALSISSIILLGISLFINAGSRSYKTTSVQATLQNETQDVLNYLNNLTQGASDAGWNNNIFYVLQPISIETSQINGQPDYFVHCIKVNDTTRKMYYLKKKVSSGSSFSNSTFASLKTAVNSNIEKEENIISTQVSYFNAVVERVGSSSLSVGYQSVSKVTYSLDVISQGKVKGTKLSVKPRNLITDTNYTFEKVNMGLTQTKYGASTETGTIARPNGDFKLNGDAVTTP